MPLTRDIVFIAQRRRGARDHRRAGVRATDTPTCCKDVEYLMTEGGDNQSTTESSQYYGVGVAGEAHVLAAAYRDGNAVARLASDEAESGSAAGRRARQDRAVRDATARHAGRREDTFATSRRSTRSRRRAWLANVKKALENPTAREWIPQRRVLERDPAQHDLAHRAAGLEQDERHSRRGDRGHRHPAAAGHRPGRVSGDAEDASSTIRQCTSRRCSQPKTPLESPIDTDLFRAIERAAHERDPGAFVTTPMLTAPPIGRPIAKLGIMTYGFDPFKIRGADIQRGMHGNDERLSVENIGFGVHFFYDMLRYAQ